MAGALARLASVNNGKVLVAYGALRASRLSRCFAFVATVLYEPVRTGVIVGCWMERALFGSKAGESFRRTLLTRVNFYSALTLKLN